MHGADGLDDLCDTAGQVHQRNIAVFADVDRSPCGSGTCPPRRPRRRRTTARGHRAAAGLETGSTLTGRVPGTVDVGRQRAVVSQVTGLAYRSGEYHFVVDPCDPITPLL